MLDHPLPDLDPANPLGRLVIQLERDGILHGINDLCRVGTTCIEAVFGHSRTKHVARTRNMIWWWLHEEMGRSYPEIARLFCRDQSTIRHGVIAAGRGLGLAEYTEIPIRGQRKRRAA